MSSKGSKGSKAGIITLSIFTLMLAVTLAVITYLYVMERKKNDPTATPTASTTATATATTAPASTTTPAA